MPTYLCHGFRWQRPSIRVFVVVQNLDEASPDWIIRPSSAQSLLAAFSNLFDFLPAADIESAAAADDAFLGRTKDKPSKDKKTKSAADPSVGHVDRAAHGTGAAPGTVPGVVRHDDGRDDVLALQDRSPVKLLEEYDSTRLDAVSRPYAYVADYVARIDLSVSVVDVMARYERLQQQRWRREHKAKEGPGPAMAGPSDEGPAFANLAGSHGGSGGGGSGGSATLSKKKKMSGWLEQLRDQLQRGEDIRWYIVVNDDEQRLFPGTRGDEEGADDSDEYIEDENENEDQDKRAMADIFLPLTRRTTPTAATMALGPLDDNSHERERERERRRLRYEMTGDPDFLDSAPDAAATAASEWPVPRRPTADGRSAVISRATAASAAHVPPPPTPPTPPSPPTLRSKRSGDLRPKTPSGGGLRRLFGRPSKTDDI